MPKPTAVLRGLLLTLFIVRTLIDKGAKVDTTRNDGGTSLLVAS